MVSQQTLVNYMKFEGDFDLISIFWYSWERICRFFRRKLGIGGKFNI